MKHPETKYRSVVAATALALGVAGAGPAAASELAPPLESLDAYLGHWQCDGTMFASPAGPAHAFAARYEVEADLGGRWVAARCTETVTDAHPVAFDHLELWGYDQAAAQLVNVFVNSAGDAGRLTAPRVDDGRLIWQGESRLGGRLVPFRGVIERRADAMVLTPTLGTADGTWTPIAELVCRR